MKQSERRHLRTNEVASAVTWLTTGVVGHRSALGWTLLGLVLVAAAVGGYFAWRYYVEGRASVLLADGLVVATTPVVTPAQMLTNPPPQGQQTFASTEARAEASVSKLLQAADAYPSTTNGIAARYYAAAALAETSKLDEARQQYQQVIDRDGNGLWGRVARLGLATVDLRAKRYDAAIAAFRDLATTADTDLPADGLLMELAAAYQQAGKRNEAVRTYNRIVNEFPDSLYVDEAKSRVETLKTPEAS
ncbi:MAG: tetratricopeptide repeat protein [Luteitalea sp.]|nr:tetratricopeptide repeat protein [Luteitalea sp.]